MRVLLLYVLMIFHVQVYGASPVNNLTPTPPMGWNSWDCFGMEVNEVQVKAVADYMAKHLKQYGWEYVVIDAGWYHPVSLKTEHSKRYHPIQNLDQYGRLIPDTIKFPSAKGGVGFKKLADYIHSKGLKFGIHVQRGIPWNAITQNTPVKGSSFFAKEIANVNDSCRWSPIMKGLNLNSEGAQLYLNSMFHLYAEWGVDFIKLDDMVYPFQKKMAEAVRTAIDQSSRNMVLSLSGGEAPVAEQVHLTENANMWRISGDFWDGWKYLKKQFDLLSNWHNFDVPGSWPDADMIPFGKLRKTGCDPWVASLFGKKPNEVTDEYSRLTDPEKETLMTLWCIFKSPLFLGGYLPENDLYTNELITNRELIELNQRGNGRRELMNENGIRIWQIKSCYTSITYLAIFNTNDTLETKVPVSTIRKMAKQYKMISDVWKHNRSIDLTTSSFLTLPPHSVQLLKVQH